MEQQTTTHNKQQQQWPHPSCNTAINNKAPRGTEMALSITRLLVIFRIFSCMKKMEVSDDVSHASRLLGVASFIGFGTNYYQPRSNRQNSCFFSIFDTLSIFTTRNKKGRSSQLNIRVLLKQ
jgi:hypothetical protein